MRAYHRCLCTPGNRINTHFESMIFENFVEKKKAAKMPLFVALALNRHVIYSSVLLPGIQRQSSVFLIEEYVWYVSGCSSSPQRKGTFKMVSVNTCGV